jgi:hypothetical protein
MFFLVLYRLQLRYTVVMNRFNNLRLSESVWKSCIQIESQIAGIIFNSIIRIRPATCTVKKKHREGNEFFQIQFSLWSPKYRRISILLFCGEGPRSRCYGRTEALRLIVQPCDEDDWFFPCNGAPVE